MWCMLCVCVCSLLSLLWVFSVHITFNADKYFDCAFEEWKKPFTHIYSSSRLETKDKEQMKIKFHSLQMDLLDSMMKIWSNLHLSEYLLVNQYYSLSPIISNMNNVHFCLLILSATNIKFPTLISSSSSFSFFIFHLSLSIRQRSRFSFWIVHYVIYSSVKYIHRGFNAR